MRPNHPRAFALLFTCAFSATAFAADTAGPGTAGIWKSEESVVIFTSNFDDPNALEKISEGYQLVEDETRGGRQVLLGEITKPKTFRRIEIPFSGLAGREIQVSFRARSPDGTRCAVWLRQDGQKKFSMQSVEALPKAWKFISGTATIPTDAPGAVEVVAPSSYNAPPGKAFLDDITLRATDSIGYTLEHPEDFPVLCGDAVEGAWLAVTARIESTPQLRISRVLGSERRLALEFQPEGITGLGMPAIAEWSHGCVVCVPVEREHRWQIACLFLSRDRENPEAVQYLDAGGSANIDPALAGENDRALVVWEGNPTLPRRIYAAEVGPEEVGPISSISAEDAPSSNPEVVFLNSGSAFAAWDTYDGESVNLYGCRYREGEWEEPFRLTSDPRIERHVDLAASPDGELWLAWQAQSFPAHNINNFNEQRIVVGRWNGAKSAIETVPGLFETVSLEKKLVMRPQIAFSADGQLVITARASIGSHSGWRALAWTYSGAELSEPTILWRGQGRWRPAAMAAHGETLIAACQRDNLPTNWGIDVGKAPDWKSEVVLVETPVAAAREEAVGKLQTVPLAMPETDFSLRAHTEGFSNSIPRATAEYRGKPLRLFWGDMHEHSDLSVCQRAGNPPLDDLWANQRDIESLDFTAVTDHGYNLDHPQWYFSGERVRAHFDAGRFVSLLAEEWTSDHVAYEPARSVRRYGHHNLIFEDPYHPHFYDSRDLPAPAPRDVWNQLEGAEFISIPHQLADTGNCPTDWTYHDEHHQPLAEIFQQRESYEYLGAPRQATRATPFKGHYLQDAWRLGLIIGVIASADHGGGKGKAAIWAEELTPAGLFEAFHARHTFGTSGAKMMLWVGSGESMMGDKVVRSEGEQSIPFEIRAAADRPITRVVVLRNNQEVFRAEPGTAEVDLTWTDEDAPAGTTLWYYVRIHREDEELAWSSPIWFFQDRESLEATADHARKLPELYPEGPPSDDPGPQVNWRKNLMRRYK